MNIHRNVLAMQGAHKRSVMYEQQLGSYSVSLSIMRGSVTSSDYLGAITVWVVMTATWTRT